MESLPSQKPQHKVKWSLSEVMKPSVTWQTLTFTSLKRRLQSAHPLCIGKWQQCGCIVMPTTGCHKVPADEVPAAKSQLSKHSNYKHSSCCCLYLLRCECACVWMHASFFFINAYKKHLFIKVYSCLFCSMIDIPSTNIQSPPIQSTISTAKLCSHRVNLWVCGWNQEWPCLSAHNSLMSCKLILDPNRLFPWASCLNFEILARLTSGSLWNKIWSNTECPVASQPSTDGSCFTA